MHSPRPRPTSSLKRDARAGGPRRSLEARRPRNWPPFWDDLAELGWLGLHIPEEYGGSGYGLPELVVVVEELGRAVAPGPFVPTSIASAVIAAAARRRRAGAAAAGPGRRLDDRRASRSSGDVTRARRQGVRRRPAWCSAAVWPTCCWSPVGDDVAVVDRGRDGVDGRDTAEPRSDPPCGAASRSTAPRPTVHPGRAPGARRPGAARSSPPRPSGVARECTELAVEYAKVREQFGRPIATFQAVKHHCANMLVATELGDRRGVGRGPRRRRPAATSSRYTAAMAATLAIPAADLCAQLNIQVHGGIGFTWEHDAHLYLRRATALRAILDAEAAADDVTALYAAASTRASRRPAARGRADPRRRAGVRRTSPRSRRRRRSASALIETGYVMPHWPKPWGRDAGAVEQLVIEQEFARRRHQAPAYGITGWVILTLIQHATEDQVARWVRPRAQPGRDLVPAVQRARRRVRRGRREDARDAGRRRLAGQRSEGVDQRRARRRLRPRDRAHQSRRAEARRHHHDGDRHARRRCRGAAAARCRPATRSSTRCSSTTCSCPTTTSSVRSTAAGRSPARRSATRA